VATGARSVANESYDAEWRVKNPAGDTVMVMTPFHRLAAASRNAAFNDLARCMYGFPSRDVPGGGTATLVVSDGEGRDISRFTINLARMR
jgi:hypothetical protein